MSPGWQSRTSHIASRVEKRIALTLPVFILEINGIKRNDRGGFFYRLPLFDADLVKPDRSRDGTKEKKQRNGSAFELFRPEVVFHPLPVETPFGMTVKTFTDAENGISLVQKVDAAAAIGGRAADIFRILAAEKCGKVIEHLLFRPVRCLRRQLPSAGMAGVPCSDDHGGQYRGTQL